MKLIDADALKKDVLDLPNCYNGFSDTYDKSLIIGLIDEQIAVDAVPVVRCKDCRYWKDQAEGVVEVPVCEYDCRNGKIGIAQIMGAEDYCSHGERIEDGVDC